MRRTNTIRTVLGLGVVGLTAYFGGAGGIVVLLSVSILLLRFWKRLIGALIYQLIGLCTLLLLMMTKGSTLAIVVSLIIYSVLIFHWAASYSSIGRTVKRKREKNDENYQSDDSLHSLVR